MICILKTQQEVILLIDWEKSGYKYVALKVTQN